MEWPQDCVLDLEKSAAAVYTLYHIYPVSVSVYSVSVRGLTQVCVQDTDSQLKHWVHTQCASDHD